MYYPSLATLFGSRKISVYPELGANPVMGKSIARDHEGLTSVEALVVDGTAMGMSISKCAKRYNLCEKTVWSARQREHVKDAIFRRQNEVSEVSDVTNLNYIPRAIEVLNSIVNDPDQRAADRIAAARALMTSNAAFQERLLMQRQVRDLENKLFKETGAFLVFDDEQGQFEEVG